MRYGLVAAFWALTLTAGPADAGRYDEPGFLSTHLVSGGVPKDGIPALTNPNFVAPNEVGYLRGRRGDGAGHQWRAACLPAQHRLVE